MKRPQKDYANPMNCRPLSSFARTVVRPAPKALVSILMVATIATCFCAPRPASAQRIGDRTALNALLIGGGATDTFEGFVVPAGNAELLQTATLNAASVTNAGGPGLVSPGVTYASLAVTGGAPSGGLGALGVNYFGLPSKALGTDNITPIIRFSFSSLVTAYGVDLLAFRGFNDTAAVRTFAVDGVTLLNTTSGLALTGGSPSQPVFFGFRNAAGIGAVEVQGARAFSPVLDTVQFGVASAAVPEPGSLALVGTGLAIGAAITHLRRRKKA